METLGIVHRYIFPILALDIKAESFHRRSTLEFPAGREMSKLSVVRKGGKEGCGQISD
jgi:hypothetical protein